MLHGPHHAGCQAAELSIGLEVNISEQNTWKWGAFNTLLLT